MQSHLIVLRTTVVGALCASGAVACGLAGERSGPWLPLLAIAVVTLIMWILGRTLQGRLLELERIGEVTRSHALQMQQSTEAARVMAASVADRALAESHRVRNQAHPAPSHPSSDAATLAAAALDAAQAVRDQLETLPPADAAVERCADTTAAELRAVGSLARSTHRQVLNAALDATRSGQPLDAAAITTALRELTHHCDEAARGHAALLASAATADHRAEADRAQLLPALAVLVEQLASLHRELGTGTVGPVATVEPRAWLASEDAANAMLAVCVDARYIEHELGTLQGARPVDDIGDYQLPPHPLDWDQLDAKVQRDVRSSHETGNIAVLDEP